MNRLVTTHELTYISHIRRKRKEEHWCNVLERQKYTNFLWYFVQVH